MSMEGLLAEVDTPPTKSTAFGASPCNDKQTGLMSTVRSRGDRLLLPSRDSHEKASTSGVTVDDATTKKASSPIWKDPEQLHKSLKAI